MAKKCAWVTADDLRDMDGMEMSIGGEKFILNVEGNLSGDWVYWEGGRYRLWATPNYEITGVPIDLRDLESDGHLDDENYYGDVESLVDYFEIVQKLGTQILERVRAREA
jgi:phage-related protein